MPLHINFPAQNTKKLEICNVTTGYIRFKIISKGFERSTEMLKMGTVKLMISLLVGMV